MVVLEKLNWIGEVPVTERHPEGKGDVVAVAKVEKTKSGAIVYHIDLSNKPVEILHRGFSLGEVPITEEDEGG